MNWTDIFTSAIITRLTLKLCIHCRQSIDYSMMKMEKLKRKSETPVKEPTKRPRTGSESNPSVAENLKTESQPPPEISFGVNPSPHAEMLAAPLGGLPIHFWVNNRAVTLFAQVDVHYLC